MSSKGVHPCPLGTASTFNLNLNFTKVLLANMISLSAYWINKSEDAFSFQMCITIYYDIFIIPTVLYFNVLPNLYS